MAQRRATSCAVVSCAARSSPSRDYRLLYRRRKTRTTELCNTRTSCSSSTARGVRLFVHVVHACELPGNLKVLLCWWQCEAHEGDRRRKRLLRVRLELDQRQGTSGAQEARAAAARQEVCIPSHAHHHARLRWSQGSLPLPADCGLISSIENLTCTCNMFRWWTALKTSTCTTSLTKSCNRCTLLSAPTQRRACAIYARTSRQSMCSIWSAARTKPVANRRQVERLQ